MKVAVTGAQGMIGSALAKALREKGHKVAECTHRNCDVLDTEQVRKALKGFDAVVHCAAELNEDAKDLYEVNVRGTENVLEACAQNGISQFIFLSTVGVFGLLPGMKDENTEQRPETEYERSKLEGEKRVLSYQEVFHITIIRPAIVLGNNRYWRQIIRMVGAGFPLIGSGKNRWQTICLEDLASAIAFCIGREECYGEIFIAAEKEPMTLGEIVERIRKETGKNAPVKNIPLWLGNIIARINSVLNLNPILKPAYVKRLQAERWYSTRKLEALGWKAKCSARAELPEIVKAALAEKKK